MSLGVDQTNVYMSISFLVENLIDQQNDIDLRHKLDRSKNRYEETDGSVKHHK